MASLFIIAICCKPTPKTDILPFITKPDLTPEWISEGDKNYTSIHTIPPFEFTNQDGEVVTEKTVEGKIFTANFIFTRCGSICPTMTDNIHILQTEFMNDPEVIFLSHTVAPWQDSVDVLKKYAQAKGIVSHKWHLLTGDKAAISTIAKKEYFAGDSMGYYGNTNDFLHTENVMLIDKKRRIRGVYNGTLPIEMQRIIEDIRTLKQEE